MLSYFLYFVYVIMGAMTFRFVMYIRKVDIDKSMDDPLQFFGAIFWPITLTFILGYKLAQLVIDGIPRPPEDR